MNQISYSAFGQTSIDEDEKLALIPNLTRLEDINNFEHENIVEARKWALTNRTLKNSDLFDEGFLLNLHQKMFDKTWKWAGQYRRSNKNIGCDAYEIRSELRKLKGDIDYWLKNNTYSFKELSLVFHHRLVKIHLFSNGNGRHARLASDCLLKKYSPKEKIDWLGKNFSSVEVLRKDYIKALRKADFGDYSALFKLFT